jgi:hypothetical protein
MSDFAMRDRRSRPARRIHIWILLAVAAAGLLAANAHLVYVATTSQPACVMHVKPGEAGKASGLFSAAKSSCSPIAANTARLPAGGAP